MNRLREALIVGVLRGKIDLRCLGGYGIAQNLLSRVASGASTGKIQTIRIWRHRPPAAGQGLRIKVNHRDHIESKFELKEVGVL